MIVDPTPPPPVVVTHLIAVGADAGGGPQVNVYDASTGQLRFSFYAYPSSFTGGVRVAVGDVNGDGTDDIITAAGPGGGPQVNVYDGKTGQLLRAFYAFPQTFTGGVFVAAGDLSGAGFANIIAGADAGGGPQVDVYSGKDGTLQSAFDALSSSFTGGVRVAVTNLAGHADIIAGAGPGALPQVTLFDGTSLKALQSFWAFPTAFRGGVYVAGDSFGDIIVGAGAGGGPQVSIFNGATGVSLAASLMSDSAG